MASTNINNYYTEEREDSCCDRGKSSSDDSLSEQSDSDSRSSNVETRTNKGYQIPISQETADSLYAEAGTPVLEATSDIIVTPSIRHMTTIEESLILKAKHGLNIEHDLDHFQVQSLLALQNGDNVLCVAPCGSGKMLVFYIRKNMGIKNGIGVCMQPLNNILNEKTNYCPHIETCF